MKSMKKWLPFKRDERSLPAKQTTASSPHYPIAEMKREMDRMFDRFLADPFGNTMWPSLFGESDRWFGDFSSAKFAPSIDVADEKKNIRITAELPGMDEKDIELSVQDDALVIRGEKKVEHTSDEDGYYRTERSYGSFERWIPLPVEIDSSRAEATFKKGVLTVRIPKTGGEAPRKQIPIRTS